MTLDLLDAAFVRRRPVHPQRADAAPSEPAPPAPPVAPVALQPVAPQPVVAAPTVVHAPPRRPIRDETPRDERLVTRLLERAPEEWTALAGHVEAARQRGRRIIAVAGSRVGEGRSTLVACLAATLRARGRDVVCTVPHDVAVVSGGPDGRGATHDKRIVLVDAGIWFPPGPIRRASLQIASLGCEAAILVRRAGASGGLARQAALEGLGIEVLGEVLTFATPLAADGCLDGDVAA